MVPAALPPLQLGIPPLRGAHTPTHPIWHTQGGLSDPRGRWAARDCITTNSTVDPPQVLERAFSKSTYCAKKKNPMDLSLLTFIFILSVIPLF